MANAIEVATITLSDGSTAYVKDATARSGLSGKVDVAQGLQNKGKFLKVGNTGNM